MSRTDFYCAKEARLRDLQGLEIPGDRLAVLVDEMATQLRLRFPAGSGIAVALPNSPAWIAVDLAIQTAGMVCIPIPDFFTAAQSQQVFESAGVVGLVHRPGQAQALASIGGFQSTGLVDALSVAISANPFRTPSTLPPGMGQKRTFTSGSTGAPKGVPVSMEDQAALAQTLSEAIAPLEIRRHLSMLPLPVLLENIAGVYTALWSGIDVLIPDLSRVGLTGSSRFDPAPAVDLIIEQEVESLILLPQMLFALVGYLVRAQRRISSLKFVAVGGAHTPPALLMQARALGIPAYEGYGLSEAASVICLNLPGRDRPGSVGQPLGHRQVKLAADGEILFSDIRGTRWTETGDLGAVDAQGFVSIHGRKKNLLITGYGRNVSPEWPETVLLGSGVFAQVIVYGEGASHLSALVFPIDRQTSDAAITAAIEAANTHLPDYAQIGSWQRLQNPCSFANGLATANGRIRRDVVGERLLGRVLPNGSLIALEEVLS
jgi:long-subunit acyl-CoA synthetase (AMP-forming)